MINKNIEMIKLIANTCPVIINNPLNNNEDIICRTCYDSSGYLYQVCNCNGSIKYIHINCLLDWLNRFPLNHKNNLKCEICNQEYIFKIKKNSQSETKNSLNCLFFIVSLYLTFFCLFILFITYY